MMKMKSESKAKVQYRPSTPHRSFKSDHKKKSLTKVRWGTRRKQIDPYNDGQIEEWLRWMIKHKRVISDEDRRVLREIISHRIRTGKRVSYSRTPLLASRVDRAMDRSPPKKSDLYLSILLQTRNPLQTKKMMVAPRMKKKTINPPSKMMMTMNLFLRMRNR
jgi:hypothetical protein